LIRCVALVLMLLSGGTVAAQDVAIGSKKFTESVILGDIVAAVARDAGATPTHRRELGGTRVLWSALLAGDIDAYVEYTGTLTAEIIPGENLAEGLAKRGVVMGPALGFNNTYAIGVTRQTAERLSLKTLSDLKNHPALRFGFNNEFLDRGDGWRGLQARYALPQQNVRGLDHDLAYRALAAGEVDATDVYTTDAEIPYYGLVLLQDDLHYFPQYDAVLLYRADLAARAPRAVAAFQRLAGTIDAAAMAGMNRAVKLDGKTEGTVAANFVSTKLGLAATARDDTIWSRLWRNTLAHLVLVGVSLAGAILIAVPLGVLAARREKPGHAILAVTGILQTIPSLALLVFMIPLLGIGGPPAIVALFLYSLLPIVRNTHAGLVGLSPSIRESVEALGLTPGARLRLVELPLAAPAILAGIKTAAVINIGTATLGALIGAGGYGQPILTGIRLDDVGLILEGAVPAAVMALAAQALFEWGERLVVPRGLRLRRA
jgi:osmoprotectant transport system permease protein